MLIIWAIKWISENMMKIFRKWNEDKKVRRERGLRINRIWWCSTTLVTDQASIVIEIRYQLSNKIIWFTNQYYASKRFPFHCEVKPFGKVQQKIHECYNYREDSPQRMTYYTYLRNFQLNVHWLDVGMLDEVDYQPEFWVLRVHALDSWEGQSINSCWYSLNPEFQVIIIYVCRINR